MSDSRLEKFIYAICSMDVSDLPVPLSRIEKLWNCLITGETPDFEPLSRNEKYLMAMLDRYDISNLPAPMSRGEKLLYKIAVGETDLSDVPGYLSRYEELLKYLIENGGGLEKEVFNAISKNGDILVTKNGDNLIYNGIYNGGISEDDFEYVLYTLNQSLYTLYMTAEKPVKSAILKGNSEVVVGKNKCNMEEIQTGWLDGSSGEVVSNTGVYIPVKVSGTITISNFIHDKSRYVYEYDASGNYLGRNSVTTNTVTLSLNENTILIKIGFYDASLSVVKSLELQVEQGEVATEYEPYNSTLVSVKMPVLTTTGKNLFDGELENGAIISSTGVNTPSADNVRSVGYIKVNPNASIVLSNDLNYSNNIIYEYDSNKDYIGRKTTNPFTTSTNCHYIRFRTDVNQPNLDVKYQIEYGTIATPYEPFKSNILTANEDVTLRSNGDICDELNLLTGQLTQRIGVDGVVLSQEVVKTVDLTVVDQDNQPTELGTFENVTHVSLETENLIPEVEMEVATNLLEDTVFNLTNAFNTLYPTAAKPVVDGTLYGQTSLSVSNYTFLTGKYLYIDNGTFVNGSTNHKYIEDYFVIPEGTQVITLKGVNNYKKICYYDSNKQFIIGYNLSTQNPDDFATNVPTGASYFRFNTSVTKISGTSIVVDEYLHVYVDDYLYLTNKPNYMDGAKLISCKIPSVTMTNEDNTKSTTLSTPSDLELRGIGDVKDELNLLTGELTSSLGEVVLDGTQKGMGGQRWGNYTKTRFELIGAKDTRSGGDDVPLMSDKLKPYGYWGEADKGEYFFTGNNYIDIVHSNEKDIVQWLKDNPTLIIYPLIESTIKTVDLTVVNQDGNVTTLETFDDTTHVLLNSEGLIPTAVLTVRTKIPSGSSTSLLMDDISTNQQQLNTTVDEQSENVDATMIATTEIFEETL